MRGMAARWLPLMAMATLLLLLHAPHTTDAKKNKKGSAKGSKKQTKKASSPPPRRMGAGKAGVTAVRKEWRELTASEQSAFLSAVSAVKARPYTNYWETTSYDAFVLIHQYYKQPTHNTPMFLPWHRYFLRGFEIALQSVNPSVTLPYWDFTLDSQAPRLAPIFNQQTFGQNGDPSAGNCVTSGKFTYPSWAVSLFPVDNNYNGGQCLERALDPAWTAVSPDAVNRIISTSADFETFRKYLDFTIHANLHVGINGNMWYTDSSVNDPLFWLTHAALDRLWWKWQAAHPSVANTWSGGATSTELTGMGAGNTVASVMDTTAPAFNYVYTTVSSSGRRRLAQGGSGAGPQGYLQHEGDEGEGGEQEALGAAAVRARSLQQNGGGWGAGGQGQGQGQGRRPIPDDVVRAQGQNQGGGLLKGNREGFALGRDKNPQCNKPAAERNGNGKGPVCYPSAAPDSWYIQHGMDVALAHQLQTEMEAIVDGINAAGGA